MFKFCSLFSGSTGNSLLVQTNNTKILIDAGESCKKISEALFNIDIIPNSIDAILVTHEHSDHTKGIGTFSKKYNIPVYANKETWDSMSSQKDKLSYNNIMNYTPNEKFMIGDLIIKPFNIPHDAANPCGFNILHDKNKISIATDLGHINSNILSNLENSSFVLLEANYDPNILQCSSYPYHLKQRIAGPKGHLSNELAGKTISHLLNTGLETVMLGHLSKENNFPELAYKTVVEELIEQNYDESSIKISVANRYSPTPIIDIA